MTPTIEVGLLDGFRVAVRDRGFDVPAGLQHFVAFVALQSHGTSRHQIAGQLWGELSEARASANVRNAVWRLNRLCPGLLGQRGTTIAIDDGVAVDVVLARATCERLLRGHAAPGDGFELLTSDVLPGWYDDWVQVERERFHQLRLHALEAWCQRLLDDGQVGAALDVGLATLAADPLRESAHHLVMRAHLAEGNRNEALKHYARCAALLRDELGVKPALALRQLAAAATADRGGQAAGLAG